MLKNKMSQIVPKSEAPGADFCGADTYYYIVRSELGCYMKSTNFNEGSDLGVFSLHNSCRGGHHYLAHEDGLFYIIKGTNYHRVKNMNTDEGGVTYSLHPNCQGGDHYLSAFGHFYIIFQERGVYRKVTNMHSDENANDYTLHPDCRNGLYYWGTKDYYYFVKPHDEWGIQYYKCTDFSKNTDATTYSFHGNVAPFIPGGLALIEGPAFGRWESIKTISNSSDSPIEWSKTITKKVGYNKKKMSSMEHNWNISMTAQYETGDLAALLSKYQFSVTAEYGGSSVKTSEEDWSEATEVAEALKLTLKPKSKIYIWQYQLGLGNEPVLFCRDMQFTSDPTPPPDVPLPPSNNK